MGKIAFVFAGQGAQYPGMGRDLYDASATARAIFDRAEAMRPGTLAMCFEGPADALSQTVNTQPCLFVMDYVCGVLAREAGIAPDMCAGFSLGEMAAVAFSGMLDFDDAFRLVTYRAGLMQACAEANPGAMHAVLRLTGDQVRALCAGLIDTFPVNFNAPAQTVVACAARQEQALLDAVKAAGGRAMKLNVSGAFHSPFMAPAAYEMRAALDGAAFHSPAMPVYANRTAQPYAPGAEADTLASQTASPVRWCETIENMWQAGVRTFVELGAGKTLCGLIKKICPDAAVAAVGDCAGLNALANTIKEDCTC